MVKQMYILTLSVLETATVNSIDSKICYWQGALDFLSLFLLKYNIKQKVN